MSVRAWLLLAIAACLASAAAGYSHGVGVGAETIARIAAQNQRAESLARIRGAIDGLDDQDPAHARRQHLFALRSSVIRLGMLQMQYPQDFECNDGAEDTMTLVRDRLDAVQSLDVTINPEIDKIDSQYLEAGLGLCPGEEDP